MRVKVNRLALSSALLAAGAFVSSGCSTPPSMTGRSDPTATRHAGARTATIEVLGLT